MTVFDIEAEGFDGCKKQAFRDGWDRLNAKRGFSWETNPFVWRIEFKRIEK